MNGIFTAVFLVCTALFLVTNPDGFLAALLAGGEKAAVLSLSLLAVYCVWLGFFKVMERSGLADELSLAVYPLAKRLFRSDDREAVTLASCNLTANFLGLPGAPTPLGVKAVEKFCAASNRYAADMLFVLNATSLQLLPTTVIALRLAAGSSAPADIFLPTLLATLLSTLLGGLLVFLTGRRK
ncbi:MAG: spore maturation protein A [Clostridia bacterium]|nr:spore maturation protein A [Clostridia bacterium]